MTQMKGIACCGDCGYYNWEKHKCTRATDEGDARSKFYADCPLPDVVLPAVNAVPVVQGEWVEEPDRVNHYHCSNCGVVWGIMSKAMKYCPNCAAKMMDSPMWDVEGERRDGDA